MTSSPTTRNRLLKQGTGDNTNTWGDQQSSGDFDMIDAALDGVLQLAVTGPVTLTTANYVDDQARRRVIKITTASTASATITLPAVEKWYLVWNAAAFDQTIACSGGGASAVVKAGECVPVACDGTNVARLSVLTESGPLNMGGFKVTNLGAPSTTTDATTKAYVDGSISQAAFSMGAFGVPVAAGNAGQFLTNNGSTPNWAAIAVGAISDYASDQTSRATALNATAQGYANTAQANAVVAAENFAMCMALLF